MQPYLFELASLMAIFSVAIVSPGADLAMVMRQSMVEGRQAAIITSFGIGAALMCHVTYTILGLGLIISQSVYLFNIVKWCGVAYLIYIGIKSLKAGKTDMTMTAGPQDAPASRPQSPIRAFMLGFAANALNPKAVFFFLSIFSTVVSLETPMTVKFGYGLIMAGCLIAWFVAVSVFMTTPRMRSAFSRASQAINRVSGAVFILLGIKLAVQKAG
ncbi:LysE family translocator [Rhizobium sp. SSA_523]|uniref:LysE family translocator n=1 Tax=Rhizobium sp. SSA_523 TaxID=2952477 RepID=UPI0020916AA7|nr:LysE family translocator [Rhizobium sp. SSA_523]MCO5733592.1 LysE family translocator [Rhizobium sp. SSA_523]WKC23111.1 LysE family translocator [Rhizobium sp. SSA_523]